MQLIDSYPQGKPGLRNSDIQSHQLQLTQQLILYPNFGFQAQNPKAHGGNLVLYKTAPPVLKPRNAF